MSHSLALTLSEDKADEAVHILFNAYWEDLEFELPPPPAHRPWRRVVDTALPSPGDIAAPGQETPVRTATYRAQARSVVILIA
jgi:glycogen operon protein